MVVNDRIAELIRESRSEEIPAAIRDGAYYDMQTLTQALIDLTIARARRPRDRDERRAERARLPDRPRPRREGARRRRPPRRRPRRAEVGGRREDAGGRAQRRLARTCRHGEHRPSAPMNGAARRDRVPSRARDRELPERRRRARACTALDRRAAARAARRARRRSPGTTTSRSSRTCCCAGRCRSCQRRRSRSKYPLVELATAAARLRAASSPSA